MTSPLEKIVFIKQCLLFTNNSCLQLINRSHVTSSWRETIEEYIVHRDPALVDAAHPRYFNQDIDCEAHCIDEMFPTHHHQANKNNNNNENNFNSRTNENNNNNNNHESVSAAGGSNFENDDSPASSSSNKGYSDDQLILTACCKRFLNPIYPVPN